MAEGTGDTAQTASQSQGTSRGAPRNGRRGRGGGSRGSGRGRGPFRPRSQGQGQDQVPAVIPTDASSQQSTQPVVPASSETFEGNSSHRGRRNRRGGGVGGQQQGGRGNYSGTSRTVGGRAFGGHLTTESGENQDTYHPEVQSLSGDAPEFVPGQAVSTRRYKKADGNKTAKKQHQPKPPKSTHPDIGTRVHEDIANGNYECVICTDEVLRSSKIWTCSGCWTVFHLKCAKQWNENGKKAAAVRESEGPQQEPYTWRCPAYRCASSEEPHTYHCWCGKDINPSPTSRALPPHSCGQTCTKPRPTCPHPCSLACHAGPCPPCSAMGPEQSCFCGKKASQRSCRETDYQNGWSCNEVCGDLLPCGEHTCEKPCHLGLCGGCETPMDARCYCGAVEKAVPCSSLDDPQQSYSHSEKSWFEGRFSCGQDVIEVYDCGFHETSESCRPQDELPSHCPSSIDVVSHCPCGKTPLRALLPEPRSSCQDPIPHCNEPCEKTLRCGHLCQAKCHLGDCPSCDQKMDISCRCGRTTTRSLCHQGQVEHPLCLRICQAKMSCGRHRCGEHCCTGEKQATERQAARKKNRLVGSASTVESEHLCLLVCGRPLKCGNHDCQQLCHRGACNSCPEAVFEEISCACGRTVLQPPQPCGTRPPECRFQCQKRPGCGHEAVAHNCHPDDTPCPRCPYLTYKRCACGAEEIPHTPCHLQEVHCGKVCGKKLKCGLHTCKGLCHREGQCEAQACTQVCGKIKMFCNHPCHSPCHGTTPCNESSPCPSKVTLTCPCGELEQHVRCLASSASPTPPERPEIKCDDECLRHERNRRLAAALNIDPSSQLTAHVPYQTETLDVFRQLGSWAETQEREFRVFAASPHEVRMRYKPTPTRQRQFLHLLAEDFGLEHQSEDLGLNRHVIVFKGPRFVSAPAKTLTQCIKIRDQQAAEAAAMARAAADAATAAETKTDPFNALVLISPKFGLTVDDLQVALGPSLATQPSFHFTFEFLFTEEVLVRAATQYSAFLSPGAVEESLTALKTTISDSLRRTKQAGDVLLCHVDGRNQITRREGNRRQTNGSGWSAVAGKARNDNNPSPAVFDEKQQQQQQQKQQANGVGKRLVLGLRKKKAAEVEEKKSWRVLGGDAEC